MKYEEINGDLIHLAKEGKFDVVAHGCNCFCRMKRGLAPQMASAFGCDYFTLEKPSLSGDINKLGQIDYQTKIINDKPLTIVNAYSQYNWSTETKPLDYAALELCFKKMNHTFKGKHIGLPQIGCHLAGGEWSIVSEMIKKFFTDCKVTVVIYAAS